MLAFVQAYSSTKARRMTGAQISGKMSMDLHRKVEFSIEYQIVRAVS